MNSIREFLLNRNTELSFIIKTKDATKLNSNRVINTFYNIKREGEFVKFIFYNKKDYETARKDIKEFDKTISLW